MCAAMPCLVRCDRAQCRLPSSASQWCGHCKQFSKGYLKAAGNLQGIVKFGAVNAETAKKTTQMAGVQGYPSVKVYMPGSGGRNPYTGKMFKPAVDYAGPRTARGVVDFATLKLPSLVVPVDDGSFSSFKGNGSLPKALLFTKKEETTPLLKSLSLALQGRMLIGEARETAAKATSEFGVSDFPTLVVLPAGKGAAPLTYDGELKPAALTSFLESHAAPAPAAADGDAASTSEDLAIEVHGHPRIARTCMLIAHVLVPERCLSRRTRRPRGATARLTARTPARRGR